jgi:hypothetical protein
VDDKFGAFVRSPTKATDEKIVAAVQSLSDDFELLETSGFLGSFAFLDCQCPCEKAIRDYCLEFLSNADVLRSSYPFIGLIKDGKPKSALLHVIRRDDDKNVSCEMMCFLIFAWCVAKEYSNPDEESWKKYFVLAHGIWFPAISRVFIPFCCYTNFKDYFRIMRTDYRTVVERIETYSRMEKTVQFLADKKADSKLPDQVFTRQDAFDTVWTLETDANIRYLTRDSPNYDLLLEHHKSIFNNPRRYGFNPWKHISFSRTD